MNSKIFAKIIQILISKKLKDGDVLSVRDMYDAMRILFGLIAIILGIMFTTFFGMVNYFVEKNVVTIVIEYFCVAIFVVSLINLLRGKNFYLNGAIIPIIVFGIIFLYMFYNGVSGGIEGIWVIILPLLNIFLGGCKLGLIVSIFEFLIILTFGMINNMDSYYSAPQLLVYSSVYWVVLALAFVFELMRNVYEENGIYLDELIVSKDDLIKKNENLENWLGIYNRNGFSSISNIVWKQAVRDGVTLSVLMIEIDSFDELDQKYGHWVCEDILKQTIAVVHRNVRRPFDLIGRYRYNTCCVLLYSTDLESAVNIAEKICGEIQEHTFEHAGFGVEISVTVSVGVTSESKPSISGNTFDKLMLCADDNLQTAKKEGIKIYYSKGN